MRILLLGSGGREHALAWKLAQSRKCDKLYIAPGNAGTALVGENVAINVSDFDALKAFAVDNRVDMVVVGPEDPLVKGIYDCFKEDARTSTIPVIGPSKQGAVLEGSKDFAKQFMLRHNIPTAAYRTFDGTTLEEGLRFLETLQPPYVLKADGLAAGKGVLIVPTIDEAKKEIKAILGNRFTVKDRYEQQADNFKVMQVEKLFAYAFLTFILLVACFNIVGSLSMLIIDKRDDIATLRFLGASDRTITRIFLLEGRLIALAGAVIGIGVGLLLCLLQQQYGLVKLGNSSGNYIVDAYPVSVHPWDVVMVFLTVTVVGWLAVYFPVRYMSRRSKV